MPRRYEPTPAPLKPEQLPEYVMRELRRIASLIAEYGQLLDYVFKGEGDPDGVITAPVGSLFLRTDGGTGTTLYVKESGVGNTGWVAK